MHIGIVTRHVGRNDGQGRVNAEIATEALRQGHRVTLFAEGADERVGPQGREERAIPEGREEGAILKNREGRASPGGRGDRVIPNGHGTPEGSERGDGAEQRLFAAPAWLPGRLARDQVFAVRSWRALGRDRGGCDALLSNGFATWGRADVNAVHFVHSSWLRSSVHPWRLRHDAPALYARLYTGLNAGLERVAFRRAGRVVAVSEKVRDELIAAGVPPDRLDVIVNGVDTAEFRPGPADRARFGLPATGPVALFAGDLRTPRKNLDSVLGALVHVPGLTLAVAGRHENTPWPALASSLGVADRVRFLGFQRDMPALMRATDVFVFPSRYEACSLVLLEALASGLPVITARSAGGAELVEPGTGVVLADSEDTAALADTLRLYVEDPTLLRESGHRARLLAERHGWPRMARRYIDLLAAAASRRTAPAAPRSAAHARPGAHA